MTGVDDGGTETKISKPQWLQTQQPIMEQAVGERAYGQSTGKVVVPSPNTSRAGVLAGPESDTERFQNLAGENGPKQKRNKGYLDTLREIFNGPGIS